MDRNLVVLPPLGDGLVLLPPRMVRAAGPAAESVYEEFLFGSVANQNTREAYARSVHQFSKWIEAEFGDSIELAMITPRMVRAYLDSRKCAIATKKLRLSALRHFFDVCVTRHVVMLNPALSVRGERYSQEEGRTPEITKVGCHELLKSIERNTIVGKRDTAIISMFIYTAARVSSVAGLEVGDFYGNGGQWMLHFREKGGKMREIPVRHSLQEVIQDYLLAAGIDAILERNEPMFRTRLRNRGGKRDEVTGKKVPELSTRMMTRIDIARMLKRRLKLAGLGGQISAHSFRVTTITDLLEQSIPLEDVQRLAGHADPRTTRLYDRRKQQITRNIVERITI
jgi:integrase/recombinase XerD